MTRLLPFVIALISTVSVNGQEMPLLRTSGDGYYLVTDDGHPFFWLGGTVWELAHRLTFEEIDLYLTNRAAKGFNVIQTVILSGEQGLTRFNAYGQLPIYDQDPTRLNEAYFELVDYTVKRSLELGIYVALLPTWGDKWNQKWNEGPEIFTAKNAEIYAKLVAQRYRDYPNIIWVLGGDRIPEDNNQRIIIYQLARGIQMVDNKHLITFHPVGNELASDHVGTPWLDIDMYQSGHSRVAREYEFVFRSRQNNSARPVINGEARYENIPDRFWENKVRGILDATDVRISAYWSILAGAAGYTYGCNEVWQLYDSLEEPLAGAFLPWHDALDLPGAFQMGIMKNFFQKLPWQEMRPDQSLILNENPQDTAYCLATIGSNGDFILAYTPTGKSLQVDLSRMNIEKAMAFWFNPRDGSLSPAGRFTTDESKIFKSNKEGWGNDRLLILCSPQIAQRLSAK